MNLEKKNVFEVFSYPRVIFLEIIDPLNCPPKMVIVCSFIHFSII